MNTTQPFRDDFGLNYMKGKRIISLIVNILVLMAVSMELITHFHSYTTIHIAIQAFNCSLLLLTLFLFVLDRRKFFSLVYLIVSYDIILTVLLSMVFFKDFFEIAPYTTRDAFSRNLLSVICITSLVGFIGGRKHIIIQGGLIVFLITYQIFISNDPFIIRNASVYYFSVCGFVGMMYYMVGILDKFMFQLKQSHDEIHSLQSLNAQKKEKLQHYNQSLIDLSRKSVFMKDGVPENTRMFKVIVNAVYQNVKCSRVSIWLLSKDKEYIYRKAMVNNGDFTDSPAELRRLDLPEYFQSIQSKPFILAPDALTNNNTRELADSYLKPNSIFSMLDCPIKLNKEVIGVLCCEHQYSIKQWEHEDVLFTQSVADHVAIHLMNMDSQALLLSIKDKNKEILDSITSAKRLQSAILPPSKLVEKYLVNSFIIYQPKDIVAGDFYWMEVIDNYIVFALADCTGHGVPGAMVSVVCHNALNRAVRDYKLLDPGEILNKTRDIVIEQFEQSEESVSDGMDISLCVYDRKKNMLRWAGANSPLLVMSNGVLQKLSPDKQPVGKFTNTNSFTSLDLKFNKGDIIYMYSDGYIDQFGGEKQEKLKYRRLCELITKFHVEDMSSQKQLFEKTFEDWKGDNEQIDDMCMIGVKFEN